MQYRTRIWHFPLIATTAALWAGFALPASAQEGEEVTINITAAQNIDATGNAHVRWVMNFNPPRGYDRVKRNYPNLYVLFRDFGPERSSFEIDRNTLKINSDDGQRSITFTADVWGAAVSRGKTADRSSWTATSRSPHKMPTRFSQFRSLAARTV